MDSCLFQIGVLHNTSAELEAKQYGAKVTGKKRDNQYHLY